MTDMIGYTPGSRAATWAISNSGTGQPTMVTGGQIAGTACATGIVGLLVWLATVPLRGRSVTGLIASVVLMGPPAVLGGIGWALFLGPSVAGPPGALALSAVAVVTAGLESGVGAARAYRRFTRSSGALIAALDEFSADHAGATRVQPGQPRGTRLLAELETVRAQLSGAARSLTASRARDQARDASRRQLIAWVSHDLHAPLTVLRAMSEMVQAPGSANSDPADRLNNHPNRDADLRQEVQRLMGVVDDLFDLATAGSAGAETSLLLSQAEPTWLCDVLGNAVGTLEPLARLRGVSIEVRGRSRVPVHLTGPDGVDLGRSVLALMVEGVRASAPGTAVRIEVEPQAASSDCGESVLLRISPGARRPAANPAAVAGDLRARRRLALCVPLHESPPWHDSLPVAAAIGSAAG